MIPQWAQEGGREQMLARLKNPATRKEIGAETVRIIREERGGGDPKNVFLAHCDFDAAMAGKNLADVAKMRGLEPTIENGAEAAMWVVEQGNCQGVYHAMSEQDLERVMRHPATMIASDGWVQIFGRGRAASEKLRHVSRGCWASTCASGTSSRSRTRFGR